MKKGKVLAIIALLMVQLTSGQEADMEYKSIDLTTLSQVNQGSSYITALGGIGNIDPLWFEGNFIPNFYIRKSTNSRLMGVITPQIIIRMFQEESFPVRTPSYIPQLTVYYALNGSPPYSNLNAFGRIAHHSNGQEGDFYLENGKINHLSGSFSTNFFELGLIKTSYNAKLKAQQFFSTSIEIHPPGFSIPELDNIYSKYRWHTAFSVFKMPINSPREDNKARFSLKAKTTWLFGNINNWKNLDKKRLELSLTLAYYPPFLEDIGLFASFYRGRDYYNIYFDNQLTVIRFGFVTEILRFNH